jgi:hypothetical protein
MHISILAPISSKLWQPFLIKEYTYIHIHTVYLLTTSVYYFCTTSLSAIENVLHPRNTSEHFQIIGSYLQILM